MHPQIKKVFFLLLYNNLWQNLFCSRYKNQQFEKKKKCDGFHTLTKTVFPQPQQPF